MLLVSAVKPGAAAAAQCNALPLHTLVAHYGSVPEEHDPSTHGHSVILANGQLVVNGTRIQHPRFSGGTVTWSEQSPAHFTSGSLHLMVQGAQLSGIITSGKDAASAAATFVRMKPVDLPFTTEVAGDSDSGTPVWKSGPPISLGIAMDAGLVYATASIDSVDVDAAAFAPPPDSNDPVVGITVHPDELAPGGDLYGKPYPVPLTARISITPDGNSFSGVMTVSDTEAKPMLWRGTAAQAAEQMHPVAMAMAASPAPAATTTEGVPLSLNDLYSLTTVDAPGIAKARFCDFMIYGMNDDWREKLFGVPKPTLDERCGAAYQINPGLFGNHASDMFILRQLSQMSNEQGGPSDAISDSDKAKIEYWFKSGIMGIDGYNAISAQLTQISWERATNGRVTEYVRDTGNNWAHQLFNALSSPRGLTAAVLSYAGTGGDLTQINRHTDMLLALSPKADQTTTTSDGKPGPNCTLASLYHSKVIAALGVQAADSVNIPDDQEGIQELTDYLAQWFKTLLEELQNNVPNPNFPAADKAAYADVEIELAQAARTEEGLTNLASELVTAISQTNGPVANSKNLAGKIQAWAENSPVAKGMKKVVKVGATGYALYSVITAFNNWNDLSDKQKAQTVITTAELPVDICSLIADANPDEIAAKIRNYFKTDAAATDVVEDGARIVGTQEEEFFIPDMRWISSSLNEGADEGSTFVKLFGKDSGYMKDFGVLVAAAAVGFSCYQIYEDRDSDGAHIALDSLNLVAATMVLVGAMVAEECCFACLGPVGAVMGVILIIVALFIPQPKPKRPADDYMDQVGNKLLSSLPGPPAPKTANA